MRARLLVGLIGMIALVLAGCSATAKPADANDADIGFSTQMIPHHAQTIQIADLVPDRSTDASIRQLATQIKAEETTDIEVMSGWLRSWNVEVPQTSGHTGHAGMAGMLTTAEIDSLRATSGAEFNQLWLTTLAKHLRNGVDMAKAVQTSGIHAGTKALAQSIITTQEAEIDEITRQLSMAPAP